MLFKNMCPENVPFQLHVTVKKDSLAVKGAVSLAPDRRDPTHSSFSDWFCELGQIP